MAGKYIRLRRGWARMRLRTVGSGVAVAVARGSAEGRRREAKMQIMRAVWGEGGSGGGGGFESQGRARRPAWSWSWNSIRRTLLPDDACVEPRLRKELKEGREGETAALGLACADSDGDGDEEEESKTYLPSQVSGLGSRVPGLAFGLSIACACQWDARALALRARSGVEWSGGMRWAGCGMRVSYRGGPGSELKLGRSTGRGSAGYEIGRKDGYGMGWDGMGWDRDGDGIEIGIGMGIRSSHVRGRRKVTRGAGGVGFGFAASRRYFGAREEEERILKASKKFEEATSGCSGTQDEGVDF
ncbi:hypothetical protein K438DRAFT_1782093 [Mycena galopus ATCC 62051]|nr:hypothetical protein K438DRAFT_1782093 [Mycena galopus ATCC 62051]